MTWFSSVRPKISLIVVFLVVVVSPWDGDLSKTGGRVRNKRKLPKNLIDRYTHGIESMISNSTSSSHRCAGIFLVVVLFWVNTVSSFHTATTKTTATARPTTRPRRGHRFVVDVVSRPFFEEQQQQQQAATLLPTLDEWVMLSNGRIQGRIRNHPDLEDGAIITTSPTVHFPCEFDSVGEHDHHQGGIVVETQSGSRYMLSHPSPTMENIRRVFDCTDSTSTDDYYFAIPTEGMAIEELQQKQEQSWSGTKQLMQQVKDAGIAGVISYAFWEVGFWAVSVPVCIAAYRQVTGHWPDFSNQEDLQQLGAEAFAFVNLARFAVPLRIGLALSTTPWVQQNLVDRFSTKKTD
jgi:hypothetical protein